MCNSTEHGNGTSRRTTKQFRVGVFLSKDRNISMDKAIRKAGGDETIGIRDFAPIQAMDHQKHAISGEIPHKADGDYYLCAIADYLRTFDWDIQESEEEADNWACSTQPINITRFFPDLIVTDITYPQTASSDDAITVNVMVENTESVDAVGDGDRDSFKLGIFLSEDQEITYLEGMSHGWSRQKIEKA